MADYLSLLAKLVDGLPRDDADGRRRVFDRARRALEDQLAVVEPPLTDLEVDRELRSLESAIAQLTRPDSDAAGPGSSRLSAIAPEPDRLVAEPPPAIAPVPLRSSRPVPEPVRDRDDVEADLPPPIAIRRAGRKPSTLLLAGLALLAIPVAAIAFLWRDKPEQRVAVSPPPAVQPQPPATESGDNKFADRVGGTTTARPAPAPAPTVAPEPSPASGPTPTRPPDAPAPTAPPAAPAQPDLAVAQRVLMFEENTADPQNPTMTNGRAVWRLDVLNAGQNQPLETVIRGAVQVPQTGLSLAILIRRNTDPALPASHTIELSFGTVPGRTEPAPVVRDVALPMMRPEETVRGVSVAGLPVPVKENVFLIGLSDLKGDVERNAELLLRRNWIELPLRFANGQKAVLLIDKGLSGERVFNDAFRQWGTNP